MRSLTKLGAGLGLLGLPVAALTWLGSSPAAAPAWSALAGALLGGGLVGLAAARACDARRRVDEAQRQREAQEDASAAQPLERAGVRRMEWMAEELRSPIGSFIGTCGSLLETEPDRGRRKELEAARDSAVSVLRGLDDFELLAHLESGELELRPRPFELVPFVENVLEAHRQTAADRGLEFDADIEVGTPARVVADPLRLRAIFEHLVRDALAHSRGRRLSLRIVAEAFGEGDLWLRFEARDHGGETQPDVEPRHERPEDATLSLAICRRLVALMEGEMGVDPMPGGGTCFHISVILGIAAGLPREHSIEPPAALPMGERRGEDPERTRRVLIVEDNATVQRVLRLMLAKQGYEVRVAADGCEALDALEDDRFDLVLMDCEMPRMDGIEATRTIRASSGPERDVPIVAVTGWDRARDRERCFEVGMNDFVPKPVRAEELTRALRRWSGGGVDSLDVAHR